MLAILDDNNRVVPVDSVNDPRWLRLFRDVGDQIYNPRRVAHTVIGEHRVSTVFLAIDHGYDGVPQWFETMIFPDVLGEGQYQERYATWDEAVAGHELAVEWLKARIKMNDPATKAAEALGDTGRAIECLDTEELADIIREAYVMTMTEL